MKYGMTQEEIENHIINIMKWEEELVEATGYNVDAYGMRQGDGAYIKVEVGDYVYTFDRRYGLQRNYEPHRGDDDVKIWQTNIDPSQIISFTLPPKEKALRKGKGRKAKTKQLLELYDEKEGKSNG